jgi:ATP-binding protein involved in chromosome partitioning
MVDRDIVLEVLEGVVHPETGVGLVSGGLVSDVLCGDGGVTVSLRSRRLRDPFMGTLRRRVQADLAERFPGIEVSVEVETAPAAAPPPEPSRRLPGVDRILAVASGKGGVGKSTVAAQLARTLSEMGFRVGILDADIYGPSQPALFGVEDHLPVAAEGSDSIVPAVSGGVKIMSIGLFISPSDALVWRGPMAVNALRQLVRQTVWGELDLLLVDLPPGTGDVHLSVAHDLELDGAIVVTTPGELSLADVRRGVEMFRSEGIGVPVLGVVENMAWFSPAERPESRYFIFGEGGGRRFAAEAGIDFLGEVPIVLSEGSQSSSREPRPELRPFFEKIAKEIVDKLRKRC